MLRNVGNEKRETLALFGFPYSHLVMQLYIWRKKKSKVKPETDDSRVERGLCQWRAVSARRQDSVSQAMKFGFDTIF